MISCEPDLSMFFLVVSSLSVSASMAHSCACSEYGSPLPPETFTTNTAPAEMLNTLKRNE